MFSRKYPLIKKTSANYGKIELEDVVKRLKKYANEKIKKTGKASTKKKN